MNRSETPGTDKGALGLDFANGCRLWANPPNIAPWIPDFRSIFPADLPPPQPRTSISESNRDRETSERPKHKKRNVFPLEAQREINTWILNNSQMPYPSREKQEEFCAKFNLSRHQLLIAMCNRRQRLLGPMNRVFKIPGFTVSIRTRKCPSAAELNKRSV
jgi:hypothetical protein